MPHLVVRAIRADCGDVVTADFDAHCVRVLLLAAAFSGAERHGLDGLTKLAKLDFLVRYPAYLELLDAKQGKRTLFSPIATPREREDQETLMIRYRYGPWDSRYYTILGRLAGLALVVVRRAERTVHIEATDAGLSKANEARDRTPWTDIARRVDYVRENYDLSGSRLKEMIYATFPEIGRLTIGVAIPQPTSGALS